MYKYFYKNHFEYIKNMFIKKGFFRNSFENYVNILTKYFEYVKYILLILGKIIIFVLNIQI